jgi:hypothetical protein
MVDSENMFQFYLSCLSVFREYAKRVFVIVFGKYANSLNVYGDFGDFSEVLFIQSRLRIRQKYFSVHGE